MLDSALSLIVAKAKAAGLVAGTALATTALVGGGAVAVTVVSNESDVAPESSATQDASAVVETESDTESDTKTVGISPKEPKAPKADEPRSAPTEFVCDESKNHGQNVSSYAKSLPKGPGRGEQASAAARSDCGKKSAEDDPAEQELEAESEDTEVEVEKTDEQKAAEKAARAQKKAERKDAVEQKKAGKGMNAEKQKD